jgi:DNA-binding CsgD family transcriptional regulator/tetratricopeptide (TPR) repeat protein
VVRIASPTFVGRAAELVALDDALDSAEQGHATTVLIGGDAGVGKSRLLETWNDRARERGARVVSGACLDLGESGPAYVALVQAFRDLLRPLAPSAVDALVGTDRSTVALVIPELVADTGLADKVERSTPIAQIRLFDRLVRVLERASSNGPLVLELEDIHWADLSTRVFLQYLVANSRTARLLIVATFRAEEAGREHPVTSLLRQLARHPGVRQIDLLPFDADELRQQLYGILGEAPSSGLLTAIHARTEGNALFAEELIASGDPAIELPSSIGAALLARTAGLSSSAIATLRVASVAGRTTPYDVLRSAMGFPDDRLDAALREVVGANILQTEHAGERYRFRHALLQEAIYQDTLPGERRRLHSSVAEALSAQTEDRPDNADLASQLAYHWFEARDHDRALPASLAAGNAAARQAAHAEALHQYERVIELWDVAPRARADLRLADILERASRAASLSGDDQKTVTYARRALDDLDVLDDQVLRVRVLDQITRALHNLTDDAIEHELRLGGVELEGLPEREKLIVLAARVEVHRRDADLAAATGAALEGLRLADASDDPELRGDAHLILAWNLMETRDLEGAIREARIAEEFSSLADDAETECEAQTMLAGFYLETGRYELAISTARTARAFAEQVGLSKWGGPWPSFFEAEALFELGRIDESSRIINAALFELPAGWPFRVLHLLASRVSTVRGSFDDARTHLEAARIPNATTEAEDSRGVLATARAELACSENRLEDATSIVHTTARALLRLPGFTESEMVWPLVEIGLDAEATRAEIGRAAGDVAAVEATQTAAGTLLGFVDDVRRARDAAGVRDIDMQRGHEALIAGHLARLKGRDDPSLWAAAAELFPPRSPRALSARYRQAEAMLAARAPREEIRAVMAQSHAAAVDVGARPLAARMEGLARRARIDLRPMSPASPAKDAEAVAVSEVPPPGTAALRGRGLSDREIEVLTLVSAGFSNQEIGARLFITDKTASVHVSHILRKLDAASRTEAATMGVRLGLPEVYRDERFG